MMKLVKYSSTRPSRSRLYLNVWSSLNSYTWNGPSGKVPISSTEFRALCLDVPGVQFYVIPVDLGVLLSLVTITPRRNYETRICLAKNSYSRRRRGHYETIQGFWWISNSAIGSPTAQPRRRRICVTSGVEDSPCCWSCVAIRANLGWWSTLNPFPSIKTRSFNAMLLNIPRRWATQFETYSTHAYFRDSTFQLAHTKSSTIQHKFVALSTNAPCTSRESLCQQLYLVGKYSVVEMAGCNDGIGWMMMECLRRDPNRWDQTHQRRE